jgi:hypothetical protein
MSPYAGRDLSGADDRRACWIRLRRLAASLRNSAFARSRISGAVSTACSAAPPLAPVVEFDVELQRGNVRRVLLVFRRGRRRGEQRPGDVPHDPRDPVVRGGRGGMVGRLAPGGNGGGVEDAERGEVVDEVPVLVAGGAAEPRDGVERGGGGELEARGTLGAWNAASRAS